MQAANHIINTDKHPVSNTTESQIPVYIYLLLLFACTDIYLVSQIKLVYLFCVPIVFYFLNRAASTVLVRTKIDFLLVLWFLSYFLSIGHIISLTDFIAVALGQLALFLIYGFFSRIDDLHQFNSIERIFQSFLYVMVFIGILQLLLYYIMGSTWGISHETHGVGLPRMSGLSLEPDWYGVICLLAFIYMLSNKLNGITYYSKTSDMVIWLSAGMGLLLSLTRAAWVALVVTLVLLFFIRLGEIGTRVKKRIGKAMIIVLPIVALAVFLLSQSDNILIEKILQRMNVFQWMTNDGGAADSRSNAIQVMLYYFQLHPFTGNGVGGMGYISQDMGLLNSLGIQYKINAGRGSANIIVANLFDVGIFGTAFLVLFFVALLFQLAKSYRSGNTSALSYLLIIIALLIDFQFNNGLRLCFVWIILGLAVSSIAISKKGNCRVTS